MLRKIVAALAVGAVLTVPLAACGSDEDKPKVDPAKGLAAAVAKTTGINLKVSVAADAGEEPITGSYDATNKIALFEEKSEGEALKLIVTTDEIYFSGLKEYEGKTVKLTVSKYPAKKFTNVYTDPTVPLLMLGAVTKVTAVGKDAFNGTLDLAKVQATSTIAKKIVETMTLSAGPKASAIPFTASIDANGYITRTTFTLAGINDGKDANLDTTYSDFGAAVTITKPSGTTVEAADDSAYPE